MNSAGLRYFQLMQFRICIDCTQRTNINSNFIIIVEVLVEDFFVAGNRFCKDRHLAPINLCKCIEIEDLPKDH